MFMLSKYVFVSSSDGESGEGWESESEAIDDSSLYIPSPDRPVGINYIDLPNKLCFLALPQVGKFLDMINQVRGCKTPGCNGNLAPTGVMSLARGTVCVKKTFPLSFNTPFGLVIFSQEPNGNHAQRCSITFLFVLVRFRFVSFGTVRGVQVALFFRPRKPGSLEHLPLPRRAFVL